MDEADADRLRYNPWNNGPGVLPVGILNALRRPAYLASQLHRTAPPPQ
jgi:hypothetical protein